MNKGASNTRARKPATGRKLFGLSKTMAGEMSRFMEYHPAERFSRNLRSLLLEFLLYEGAMEAAYLRELLIDLDGLFDLLDAIRKEQESLRR